MYSTASSNPSPLYSLPRYGGQGMPVSEVDERDLELLKLAAKAAQLEIEPCTCRDPKWPFRLKGQSGVRAHWNPLINDGDALRLAVLMGRGDRLGIQIHIVEPFDGDTDPYTVVDAERFGEFDIYHGDDPFRATRRAIVEAAGSIGSRS